jgi:hypothetical protein
VNNLRFAAVAASSGAILVLAACSSTPVVEPEVPEDDAGAFDASSSDAHAADGSQETDSSITDSSTTDSSTDAPIVDGGVDAREAAADAAGTVVVNFDTQVNGTLTPGYAGLGWDADWYVYSANPTEYQAHSGTQFVTNNTQQGSISFTFANPVLFDGAWFSLRDNRNATVRFDVYDAANVKLGSSITMTETITPTFLPVGIAGVKKVTLVFVDDFAMDDVTYRP